MMMMMMMGWEGFEGVGWDGMGVGLVGVCGMVFQV